MALSTILGLIIGFGAVILSNSLEGGSIAGLMNLPAAVIVFGGTFAVAAVSFPPKVFLGLPNTIMQIFKQKLPDPQKQVAILVELADKARRQGLLCLEEEAERFKDPFIRKGIQLVVDGTAPETIRELLEMDSEMVSERHLANSAILDAMGGYGPTMGIIGTVMGLVSTLGRLGGDPSHLGSAIATAFLATLYGVGSANLLWLPLGSKLKKINDMEMVQRRMLTEGMLSLAAGDNPRVVRMKLEAFLPPKARDSAAAGKESVDAPARA